jgi:hypothetical protein
MVLQSQPRRQFLRWLFVFATVKAWEEIKKSANSSQALACLREIDKDVDRTFTVLFCSSYAKLAGH